VLVSVKTIILVSIFLISPQFHFIFLSLIIGVRREGPTYREESDFIHSSARLKLLAMCENGNPFAKSHHNTGPPSPSRKATSSSFNDEDVPDPELELRAEIHKKKRTDGELLLTPTTINVARFMGRYLQLMRMLPNPHLVWLALTQLFEYYLHSVYVLFCPPLPIDDLSSNLSAELRHTLQRLRQTFQNQQNNSNGSNNMGNNTPPTGSRYGGASSILDDVIRSCGPPTLSPNLEMTSAKTLFGLSSRVVAFESMTFLVDVLNEALPLLQTLIATEKLDSLNQFYSDTLSVVPELRKQCYHTIAKNLMNLEQVPNMIEKTKFDTKELGLEHSGYVDFLIREFKEFSRRLNEMPDVPEYVKKLLWDKLILHAMEDLVEGYSRAKKCTNEGRALMSLDVNIFTHSLHSISPLNPIPHASLADNYIKAFYIPSTELVLFGKEHPEYSARQVQAIMLCNIGLTLKKKQKQAVISALDDVERVRKLGK